MKRIIRLTEKDLAKIVKIILKEDNDPSAPEMPEIPPQEYLDLIASADTEKEMGDDMVTQQVTEYWNKSKNLSRLVRRVINEQAWGEFDDITPAFQVFCNSLNSKIPQPSQKPNTTSATQPKLSVKRVVNRQVDGFMWQFYLGGKPIGETPEHNSIFDQNYNMRPNSVNLITAILKQIFNLFDSAYKKDYNVISGSLLNAYNAALPICIRSITAAVAKAKGTLSQQPK
jgi:hypothetical protein